MRYLILISLITLSLFSSAQDELRLAEKAYDARQYKEAIVQYEKLISQGYKAYELYFNLGNAYYRNNELGKAIYYYELARKIEPDDEDVRINLGIANSKTLDRITSKENFFVNAVKTNLLTMLTTAEWAWITIILIALTCTLIFVYIVSSSVMIKRISLSTAALALIFFFVVYLIGYSAVNVKYTNKFGIIIAKETRVMNEPSAGATSKFALHEGTRIRVIEKNGDWVLIALDNGNEGWVRLADLGII